MGRHGVPDREPELPTGDDLPVAGSDDDRSSTLGRRSRAERRRDGLLPPGPDPMSGRAPGADHPTAGRPAAQAGPRTHVAGIPAAPSARQDTAPPVSRGPAGPPPPPPRGPGAAGGRSAAARPGAAPVTRGLPTPPPPARELRSTAPPPPPGPQTPPPPPATRGLATPPPGPTAPAPGGPTTGGQASGDRAPGSPSAGGPSTSLDPLLGSRPPAGRAPATSSLPSWATTLGPPTPAPPADDAARDDAPPAPPAWTGPERRVADRPGGVPASGDRRGARTHSIPERPALATTPPPARGAHTDPGTDGGRRPAVARGAHTDPGTDGAGRPAVARGAHTDPGTDGAGRPAVGRGPGSGETGVIGGRAASRAERQAVDAVRRREERRQGITPIPPLPDEGRRGSRGLVLGLVAVVVVALVLLGIWSFQRPGTEESAASTPTTATSAAPSTAAPTSAAPTSAAPTTPAGPVFAPVTVLNATDVNGLAGAIGTALAAGGWEVLAPGLYSETDIATTTVFYTAGDAQQEQAAATLQAQFPEIAGGPSERFFDIPGVADPGIVVVATGNWQP